MRGALLIAKKEFLELSKDRKTLFFVFVLPFLLYPAIFGMMAKMGQRWTITATTDRRRVLPGADYIINCIEVSGVDCVRHDNGLASWAR